MNKKWLCDYKILLASCVQFNPAFTEIVVIFHIQLFQHVDINNTIFVINCIEQEIYAGNISNFGFSIKNVFGITKF